MISKELLGIVSVFLSFLAYLYYFKDIFQNRTKPHAFSWLVWGSLTLVGFAGQVSAGAGPGAWVTGFTSVACFLIFLTALQKGEKKIVLFDWLSLAGAASALLLWFLTKEALLSIILVVLTDALGFFPTFRKSFVRPEQETLLMYFLSGLKFVPALFALKSVTLTTGLYPLYLVAANWLFVSLVLVRRKQLGVGH